MECVFIIYSCVFEKSGEGRDSMRSCLAASLGNSSQLTLDRSCSRERLTVHLCEAIVRCVEGEAARDANGDPDSAPIELDCKTLRVHDSAPREQ
jgi:hypothetical protein